jgi:hypothetical protein
MIPKGWKSTMNESPIHVCPILATHDKFEEAHYFLHGLMRNFHEPEEFRWNLNAFLQATRSIRDMIESELKNRKGFREWYQTWESFMDQDDLIRRFRKGRNIVVHRGMLRSKSSVEAGAFRGNLLKAALSMEIDISERSEDILHFIKEHFIDLVGGEEHPFIGEQLGVRRTWIVEESGNEDVFTLCNRAWCRMSEAVSAAHEFAGAKHPVVSEHNKAHRLENINLLLESDLDPTLPEKWEW